MPRIDTDIVTRPRVVQTNPIGYAATILGAKVRKPTGSPHAEKLVGGLQQRRATCGKPHFAILSRKAEEPGSDGTQAEETVKSKTRTGDEVNE